MKQVKTVFLYLRVSTNFQDTSMQLNELTTLCNQRGWVIKQVFEDKQSGTNLERKSFQEMNKLLRRGKADGVVCWKLDRVFRKLREALITLHEYAELGIMFYSLHDPLFDQSTPHGRLLISMIGAFAELESDILKIRVKSGLQAARDKGVILGRPKKKIDLRLIQKLKAEGQSLSVIAKELNVSKATIHRSLQKPCSE